MTSSGVIQAVIANNENRSPKITPDVIDDELLFYTYPRTIKEQGNALMLQLTKYSKENLDVDSYFSIRGNLVAIKDDSILVRIQRNANKDKVFYLGIKGTLPNDGVNSFWDLECIRSGQFLKLVNAQVVGESETVLDGIVDKPIFEPPQLVNAQAADKPKPQVVEPTNRNQDKVTTVRSEITLKFNSIPRAEPAPDKKVLVILADENENKFVILLNAKSYKKATEAAATYPKYAGSISGKLGKLTEDGFEVLEAGIKVFEVKPKDEASDEAA